MQAEVLLTLKLQQRLFADPRRITLLKEMVHTGSISQGARLAGISYKSAWDAVNEMNQLGDKPLVACATGGKGGGGAQVTDYGRRLIQLYDLLAQVQQKAFDVLSQDNLPLDSLLAAISRFSLQTSARNQWFGEVTEVVPHAVLPQILVRLAGSNTQIKAVVTVRSVQRLGLAAGKEVLVLVKAPWVQLVPQSQQVSADNVLAGVISQLEQGDAQSEQEAQSEVIVDLADGQALCATLNAGQFASLSPALGLPVKAVFNAEQVILATLG